MKKKKQIFCEHVRKKFWPLSFPPPTVLKKTVFSGHREKYVFDMPNDLFFIFIDAILTNFFVYISK